MRKTYLWKECKEYWELNVPQKDPLWMKSRLYRVTGSACGNFSGMLPSKFNNVEECSDIICGLKTKEIDEEHMVYVQDGIKNEPLAREWLSKHIGKPIVERSLIIPKWDLKRIGVSVDGEIMDDECNGIVEIKCPPKMYPRLQEHITSLKMGFKPPSNYYQHIWPGHYCQMQLGMAIMNKQYCIYMVYCKNENKIYTENIQFDPKFWKNMYNRIKQNYSTYIKPKIKNGYPLMP